MATAAAFAILALYLLVAEPLLGRRQHRALLAALAAGDEAARLRFYRSWSLQGWALAAVTLLATLALADWSPARLGFAWPAWPAFASLHGGMLGGFVVGVVVAAAAGFAMAAFASRRASGRSSAALRHNPNLLAMLPRTRAERRGWILLSLTAGIGEEIVWRGFGLVLLFTLLPAAPVAVPLALAALAFGWAHFYQGAAGMLATAVLGGVFAVLFWATGSLLWPIVLHALIDLRVLLVRLPASATVHGANT